MGAAVAQRPGAAGAKSGDTASFDLRRGGAADYAAADVSADSQGFW
jgi:hypothetical protein